MSKPTEYTPANPFQGVMQSAAEPAAAAPKKPEKEYRFNMRMPATFKIYLQIMAWKEQITITDYLNKLVAADLAAHPEYEQMIDTLSGAQDAD